MRWTSTMLVPADWCLFFFFSSRRRHTRFKCDWSSDVCSSDLQIWKNESFPDDPVRTTNTRGTFAFAMTGPNARTTQIYINVSDQSRQDADGFAPFGKVVEGMEVVDKLYFGYGETSGGGMRGGKQGKLFEEG